MENLLLAEHSTSPYLINPSFSGHQTFPFRYTWLKKGVDAVTKDPTVFSSENASVTLGVGKNMVASIRHWCRAAGLITTDGYQHGGFKPTTLGKVIFNGKNGFDPYLDDPATLWLIHWRIATNNNQATAWYWAFNILKKNQFVPKTFAKEVYEWAKQQKKSIRPPSDNTMQRDVNCFIRTYCHSRQTTAVMEESFDCPLVELNLISELPDGEGYEFQRGEKVTLPIEIFSATLIAFWVNRFTERDSLTFTDILTAPLSPGRIFRLDEDTLTLYLEKLEELTDGAMRYDETADLKQVYRHRDVHPMHLLKRYYG
jgi:hypothetical protein